MCIDQPAPVRPLPPVRPHLFCQSDEWGEQTGIVPSHPPISRSPHASCLPQPRTGLTSLDLRPVRRKGKRDDLPIPRSQHQKNSCSFLLPFQILAPTLSFIPFDTVTPQSAPLAASWKLCYVVTRRQCICAVSGSGESSTYARQGVLSSAGRTRRIQSCPAWFRISLQTPPLPGPSCHRTSRSSAKGIPNCHRAVRPLAGLRSGNRLHGPRPGRPSSLQTHRILCRRGRRRLPADRPPQGHLFTGLSQTQLPQVPRLRP